MKIAEALAQIDTQLPNTYPQMDKVRWLSNLDSKVKTLIIDTHEGGEGVTFSGYDGTDLDTELLIPAPFTDVYLRWLEAQIHYANGEVKRYNNAIENYNVEWTAYQNHYNRTHMPKGTRFKYF